MSQEKICTGGHVIDPGKLICSRCGGGEPKADVPEEIVAPKKKKEATKKVTPKTKTVKAKTTKAKKAETKTKKK